MKDVNIYIEIESLVEYAVNSGLISKYDRIYSRNRLLQVLGLDDFKEEELCLNHGERTLEDILNNILTWAVSKELIEDTLNEKDLLDTKLMAVFIDKPSTVIEKFYTRYKKSPKEATDYFYNLSKKSNYIREYRVEKDLKWKVETEYGLLDITINMAKPEKDPKDIAKAKTMPQGSYPKCLLCKENEGYEGRVNHPARGNHRIIPMELNGAEWFLQYSPYVYFNEHSIILKGEHSPMSINKDTFIELLDFVDKFKHYFIGSNADLPIVGGSILTHDHYQGGCYEFAQERATIEKTYMVRGYEDLTISRVKWPMSVIRVSGKIKERVVEFAEKVLTKWIGYSDEALDIRAYSDGVRHNTVTPIARFKDGNYEMDLVLRNNRITEEFPDGIFHPHKELHHIKKENIGLIEVMGLAVLPSRLTSELEYIKEYILAKIEGEGIELREEIEKHKEWIENELLNLKDMNSGNIDEILKREVGIKFLKVLEHSGVFKRNEAGFEGFDRFVEHI